MRSFYLFAALPIAVAIAASAQGQAAAKARDCKDLYFGLTGAPDHASAYTCYEQSPQTNGLMLALMTLNGEGTVANADKAMDRLQAMFKAQKNAKDASAEALEQLIQEQQKTGTKPPLTADFCADVAKASADRAFCDDVPINEALTGLRTAVGPGHVTLVDALSRAFSAFRLSESSPATAEDFIDIAQDTISKALLLDPAPSDLDLTHANADMDKSYTLAATKRDASGQAALKKSQAQWDAYRNAWLAVVKPAYKGVLSEKQAVIQLNTYLTQKRAASFKASEPTFTGTPLDCTFDPAAIGLAIDRKAKAVKAYTPGTSKDGNKSESAVLADGTKVTFSGGGCVHLGFSYAYEDFKPLSTLDKGTLIALATKLLMATPVVKDSQENQRKLLEALDKAKTSATQLDAKNALALPCGEGGEGPTCSLELRDKSKLQISYDFGV